METQNQQVNIQGSTSSETEAIKSLRNRVQESAKNQISKINENLKENKDPNSSIEFEIFDFISDENESTWNLVPVEKGETTQQHIGKVLKWIVDHRIPEVYEIEEQEASKQRALNRFLPEDFTQKYKCNVCGNDDQRFFLEKKDGVTCLGKNGARDCGTLIQQGYIHVGQEFRNFADKEDRNTQDSRDYNPLMSDAENFRTTAAGKDKFGREQAKLEREIMRDYREYMQKFQSKKKATTDELKDSECRKYFFQFTNFVRNKRLPQMIADRSMVLFNWIRRYSRKSERLQRAKSYAVACLIMAYYENLLSENSIETKKKLGCPVCGLFGFTTLQALQHHIDFTCKKKNKNKIDSEQNQISIEEDDNISDKRGLLGNSRMQGNSKPKEGNGDDKKSLSWKELDMMYWDEDHLRDWFEHIGGGAYFFYADQLVETIKDTITRLQYSRKNNDSDSMDSDEEDKMTPKNNSSASTQHLGWYLMHKVTVSDFALSFAEMKDAEEEEEESGREDNGKNKSQMNKSNTDPYSVNKDARDKAVFIINEIRAEKENMKKRKKMQAQRKKKQSTVQKDKGKNKRLYQQQLQALTNKKVVLDGNGKSNDVNNVQTSSSEASSTPKESVNASKTSSLSHSKRKADEEEHEETPLSVRQRTEVMDTSNPLPQQLSIGELQSLCTTYIQLQQALALPTLKAEERQFFLLKAEKIRVIFAQHNVPLPLMKEFDKG